MELLRVVLAHLLANVTTTIFFSVAYLNFVLFKDYTWTLLWSFVISQALYASKARLARAMAALSREDDTRPMLTVLRELLTEPFRRMRKEGTPMHDMVFNSTLNWCIELFALVGLMSLTSRLLSVWLLAATSLAMLPFLGLYVLDRRVFAYRRVISDDSLASVVVICTFFASVCFIVLFLGLESVLEGMSAGQSVSDWVQSMLGDETNETEWSKNIARLTEFAHETVVGFDAQYNETVWFPMARNVMSHYMEHGTLMASPELSIDNSTGVVANGPIGTGRLFDLMTTVWEHVSDLDISMEHVVNYGAPSGKVIANGVTLLASLGSFLVMVGFKVVLFFTCVVYMTNHDNFLERTVGDFLPIAEKDQKRAMNMLRGAIQGVFFLPCKVACLHGVVTLFSFMVLQVEFPFFAAFLAVLVSILPIMPAYVMCWPWALTLVLHGRWVGVVLAISQYLILSLIDTELYTQGIREANPYLTGLSSFLGFAVFGAQGVLLGPLIICLATLIYGGLGFLESSMAQDAPYGEIAGDNAEARQSGRRSPDHSPRLRSATNASQAGKPLSHSEQEYGETPVGQKRATNARKDTSVGSAAAPELDIDGKDIVESKVLSPSYLSTNWPEEDGEHMREYRRVRRSASLPDPGGSRGVMRARYEASDAQSGVPSLQLAELWASFVKNLNHTQRWRNSFDADGSRLSRRQSDGGIDAQLRNKLSPVNSMYKAQLAAKSNRVRVKLQLKASQSQGSKVNSDDIVVTQVVTQDEAPSTSSGTQWRLHVSPSLSWEAFVLEVQDVMGIPGVCGIYGKDGARIRRVNFVEDGETLDVVAEKPSG